jgi:hypothetical protein
MSARQNLVLKLLFCPPPLHQPLQPHLSLWPLLCVRVSVTLPRTTSEMLKVRSRSSLMTVGAPMIT